MATQFGALPEEWNHLSLALGLTEDLLPVVSNPGAEISPQSAMQSVGKTPSRYNGSRKVAGFKDWTSKRTTDEEVTRWSKEPDYGICVQTRTVRAIDIDIEDAVTAAKVKGEVERVLAHTLPQRWRKGSSKCLLAFTLPGDIPKRVIRLEGGIIEFLATGQQFIACGTHPSGARYEWLGGLPDDIPTLTLEKFEQLWSHLSNTFAPAPSTISTSPSKSKVLAEALVKDKVAQHLIDNGWVKSQERDGRLHITCPFEHEHTTPSAVSATTYFPANTGGYVHGHFDCRHAHCEHRNDSEFKEEIGIPSEDAFDDFDVIPDDTKALDVNKTKDEHKPRFTVVPASEFVSARKQLRWLVKGVLPHAELGMVFGDSGSGKTFIVNDIMFAIAQGKEWRGHRVNQGKVVYICAEGASGMRDRLRAYADNNGLDLGGLGVGVIADAPNFMQVSEVKAVIEATRAFGDVSLIVVDTLAQVIPGGNENAGEDMGKVLSHCKALRKHTGAMVLVIHHSGKDASKGARGWSGMRGACDVEIEVSRCDDDRVATVTKLKDGGKEGAEFGFKLKIVPVGMDEDDEVITSCVVEHTEGKALRGTPKERAQGRNERLALTCLHELMGAGDTGVSYYELATEVASQMLPPEAGKRDKRLEAAKQAVENLRERGAIKAQDGFISLVNDEEEGEG